MEAQLTQAQNLEGGESEWCSLRAGVCPTRPAWGCPQGCLCGAGAPAHGAGWGGHKVKVLYLKAQ